MAADSAAGPHRKADRWYLFCRVYCLAIISAWIVVGFSSLLLNPHDPPVGVLVVLPFFIPALWMLFGLGAFRFAYSVFGPYERTHPPAGEAALYSVSGVSGRIGQLYASGPFLSFAVFPSGLQVGMLGAGSGFVPFAYIDDVRAGRFGRQEVLHHSPEVRTPIAFYAPHVGELLEQNRGKFSLTPKA